MRGIDFTIAATTGQQHVPYLRRHLPPALKLMHSPLRELSIALVGDIRMSRLHERFMGISGPTDVLTFPLEIGPRNRATAGEVVICVPEARRRARQMGVTINHELLLYAVHGLLHLNGLDDRTERQYRRMHRMEDSILDRLGVGPVFTPKGRP